MIVYGVTDGRGWHRGGSLFAAWIAFRTDIYGVHRMNAGQAIEDPDRALANQAMPVVEVRRRNDRIHRQALRVMLGRVA